MLAVKRPCFTLILKGEWCETCDKESTFSSAQLIKNSSTKVNKCQTSTPLFYIILLVFKVDLCKEKKIK